MNGPENLVVEMGGKSKSSVFTQLIRRPKTESGPSTFASGVNHSRLNETDRKPKIQNLTEATGADHEPPWQRTSHA